jgi:hypothetical protein
MLDLFSAHVLEYGPVFSARGRPEATGPAKETRLLLDASDRAIATLEGYNADAGSARAKAMLAYVRGEAEHPDRQGLAASGGEEGDGDE